MTDAAAMTPTTLHIADPKGLLTRPIAIAYAVKQAKAEIIAHVAAGVVPASDVASFGDLHDYVDANRYGGCFDLYSRFDNDEATRIANEVQSALDEWIRSGGLRPAGMTSRTLARFLEYARDAPNWGGMPLVGGNVGGDAADNGYLTAMKKQGLIRTQLDARNPMIIFTAAGCLDGPASRAAAVLFEPEGMLGHAPPRREAGTGVAGTLTASLGRRGGVPDGADTRGQLIPFNPLTVVAPHGDNPQPGDPCPTLNASHDQMAIALLPMPFSPEQITSSENRSNPQPGDVCPTLTGSSGQPPAIAFQHQAAAGQSMNPGAISQTLGATKAPAVFIDASVRRLMPVECERLMGFRDGWTQVPYRGKPACDSPRYAAIGRSMAVNVMRWIGQRIAMVDAQLDELAEGRQADVCGRR